MSVIRREHASYTVEQLHLIVNDALTIANAADLTPEDRAVLLPAIFDKVAAKEVTYEQTGPLMLDGLGRPQG
jgi:hypothetical protein